MCVGVDWVTTGQQKITRRRRRRKGRRKGWTKTVRQWSKRWR